MIFKPILCAAFDFSDDWINCYIRSYSTSDEAKHLILTSVLMFYLCICITNIFYLQKTPKH